jgi:phosphatidylserine/phosphatidylglycerophosphate/cardiolipin synthase-like enzyme
MWGWTKWRTDIARQLWKLHDQGCNVYVVLNKKRVGQKVYQALLKRSSKNGVMKVYDAWYDKNHNGAAELYMHQKLLTINGNFNGNGGSKVLWTGSQNFTDEGNRVNNELLMKIDDDSTLDLYVANLNYIRDHHTKGLIRRVPPASYFHSASRTQGPDADGHFNGAEPFDYELPPNGDVDFDR